MTSLNKIVDSYLVRIGQANEQELGNELKPIKPEDNTYLLESFKSQQTFNRGIVVVAISVLCAIFLLGVFLVVYYRDSPSAIVAILGGNFFSLLVIVGWLRKLWLENSTMGALLLITKDVPAREAAAIITTWHFRAMKEKKSK